jgi:hypothetical protein
MIAFGFLQIMSGLRRQPCDERSTLFLNGIMKEPGEMHDCRQIRTEGMSAARAQ